MDHFNVPLLAESTSYGNAASSVIAANNNNTHNNNIIIASTTHHHKDHMLAAGNSPATPFINYNTLDGNSKDDNNSNTTTTTTTLGASQTGTTTTTNLLKSDYAEFTNCIQQSTLLDHRNVVVVEPNMDSLSGLCDLKFPSPNPHSVVVGGSGGINDTNFRHITLMNSLESKTHNEHNNNNHHQQQQHNIDSVPSFTNLLFGNRSNDTTMNTIDPKLITHMSVGNNNNNNNNGLGGITAQYHTLKTAPTTSVETVLQQQQQQQQHNVSATTTTNVIGENNAHVVVVENCDSFNIASTTITKVNNNNNANNNSKLNNVNMNYTTTTPTTATATTTMQEHKQSSNNVDNLVTNSNNSNNKLADNQITTTTTTTADNHQHHHHHNNNNNNMNNTRSTLHSIDELAASSCTSSSIAILTNQQNHHHQQQQQPPQHNHANSHTNNNNNNPNKQMQHENNMSSSTTTTTTAAVATTTSTTTTTNHNLSSLSSDCDDSISSQEDLIIDEHSGYQDTTSSHSQQSGGGGGSGTGGSAGGGGGLNSASLLNGVAGGGSAGNSAGGYMSLLPPSASSSGGHLSGVGGGNGGAGIAGGGPGGTSASAGVSGESIDFKHLFEELCPVCGDKVSGYHYGLLTCESCKGFFKRTVQNKKVYTCVAERSCHIDKTQRKRCPYCRFQKCLEVGMKLEAVRADRMRGGRNKFGPMYKRDRARKLQVMRQRQLALQALRTSMGSTDMKSTPLSPGYQQAYPNMNIKQEIQIPQVSSLTQSPDSSPSPIAIALGQVNANSGGVIATPMNGNNGSAGGNNGGGSSGGGGGSGGGSNNSGDIINRGSNSCHDAGTGSLQNTAESKLCFDSGTHPSSTADSLIEPLRVSPMIREFVQSIDDREWQTQLFALLQKQTYNQVEVDLFELMCKVLDQNLFSQVDWARNTVFFKDLKVDDQMKLLQHSWSDMLVLDHLHHRIHNGLPDETQLNNGQVFDLLSLGLLGVPQLGDFFNELQNKLQDLKFDMGDYVCMKFLILLNPDVRGIINKKTVLEGHENVQAALLDYTLTCYPSVTDKFRRLLNILPDIHAMAARGEEHLYSKHCAGSAPTQTLLMEMLHAKRKV